MVASIGDLKLDLIRSCLALFTVAVVCPHKILRGKVLSLRSPGSAGGDVIPPQHIGAPELRAGTTVATGPLLTVLTGPTQYTKYIT